MFLTKDDFQYSVDLAEAFEDILQLSDINPDLAEDYAKDVFEDFEYRSEDDQQEIVKMIMEDMSASFYTIS